MCAVVAVGVLAIVSGAGGVEAIYCGYFGLMTFVRGLLDLNMAIEHIAWHEWLWHRKVPEGRQGNPGIDYIGLLRPALYLLCAAVQLAAAILSYLVYKDFEQWDDGSSEPIFATVEQARIHNAALSHAERRAPQPLSGRPT